MFDECGGEAPSLLDWETWAVASGEPKDTLTEIRHLAERCGWRRHELAGVIACREALREIEALPLGPSRNPKNPESARKRANSRLRESLKRFLTSRGMTPPPPADPVRWTRLVDYVAGQEAPPGQGGRFAIGRSRALWIYRARSQRNPEDLDQAEIDRLSLDGDAEDRELLREGARFLIELKAARAEHPEIADLLPRAGIAPPGPVERAPRVDWSAYPLLRLSVDAILARTLSTPETQATEAEARLAAGEDEETVMADFDAAQARDVGNSKASISGYMGAIAFVLRDAVARGASAADLPDLAALLTPERIEKAVQAWILHSAASPWTKESARSTTLWSRLTNLLTIARHGLRDQPLANRIKIIRRKFRKNYKKPGQNFDPELDSFLRSLHRDRRLAARIVNGPALIAAEAERRLAGAVARKSKGRELSALRLYASAALWAVQMCRPIRPANLIKCRIAEAGDAHANVEVRDDAVELRYAPVEVKNDIWVGIEMTDGDAAIMRRWVDRLRSRYRRLKNVDETPYLLPGRAAPRLDTDDFPLPRGCLSTSSFDEIWDLGAAFLGLQVTPHQARHCVATLVLAVRPGDYKLAAAVLGDKEDTVRRHYGRDDGQAAAAALRQELLELYPHVLAQMGAHYDRRRTE